jgi:hypothetical protein
MSYDWRGLSAEEAVELTHSRDPRRYPWGYFAADSLAYGGAGMFQWFVDSQELTAFLIEVEPLTLDLTEDETEPVRQDVAKAVRQLVDTSPSGDFDPLLEQLDEAVGRQRNYAWLGRFDDLLRSEGEWAGDLRSTFREADTDGLDPSPLAARDEEDFIAFLNEYGY